MKTEEYFDYLQKEVKKYYDVAQKAREVGIDPVSSVETPIAMSLAEKAIGLISTVYPQLNTPKLINRISDLEKEYGQLDPTVCFKVAEDIAREKYCKFENLLQAIDAGIRVAFSYFTLGVVSSPIEGFTGLSTGKTREGKEYFIANFSGPIRSAGTTAGCVVLMIIDYLREVFGYAKYDPTEEEVKRYVTENYDYHERVTNLQYLPSEEEIAYLASHMPFQIAGEPTEKREVSNYKDLDRVSTNFIRGGMCLIFSEGLAQKAQKGFRLYNQAKKNGIKASGWDFLDEFIKKFKEKKKGKEGDDGVPVYIKDLVAGRPVYGHPGKSGGFRFRYGRSRTSGFSATSISPATMALSDNFLSFGNQLKIEKPTKGCAISSCDSIDGPIVKLKDGSVKKVDTYEAAKDLYKKVDEIIYLGDLLVSFGDVINRNYDLIKPGYVEEWWKLELDNALMENKDKLDYDEWNIPIVEALKISEKYKIPLHPAYIYYWTQIEKDQFLSLIDWLSRGEVKEGKLVLPYSKSNRERFSKGKRALELIGCEHNVALENVVFEVGVSSALLVNLGVDKSGDISKQFERVMVKLKEKKTEEVLDLINNLSKFNIKDKAGSFVGARMGRPEKAKLRKLTGSPHALFPVGNEGGRLRSFQAAYDLGVVGGEFPTFYCEKCKKDSIYSKCIDCGGKCIRMKYSPFEDREYRPEEVMNEDKMLNYRRRKIDIRRYFDNAKKLTGVTGDEIPIVKGVRGTSNEDHSCEHLGKGLLRAKYNLNVNKDGTIRYDMTEMAITHFKPKEIGTSVEKLKELGYEKDIFGNDLVGENQVIGMFPHDVILPACTVGDDEKADDVFLKISKFVDEELEKLYGLPKFFNAKKVEDVIGNLVVCIAPHICTASVGRIIGFSKTQTLLASPFMHAAMRRDCDGDEAAAILLMDVLLNFSKKFLPAHRGGTQDSPLVLNTYIRAGDVDDQILDLETSSYPLELYEKSERGGVHSSDVNGIEIIKHRLKEGKNPFVNIAFTHDCSDFNKGVVNSSYKSIPSMREKVEKQMELCGKLRSVDTSDVARLIIERHFIRDTRGNLRKFSMQKFRCVKCNESYRRPPLGGKCLNCGGRIIFTISEGSVLKYMQPALDLARNFEVSSYLLECLELTEMYIHSIFGKEKEKQEELKKWF